MLRTLTVAQCAEMLQTTEIAVLKLIHSGELVASNINTKKNAQRPRWRVPETELASLLMRNRFQSPDKAQTPKRSTRKATPTKDYFGGDK